MKRIVLVIICIAISTAMNSCTSDDLEQNIDNKKFKISANSDSGGDQNGQTTIPPLKQN